jgi:hypothetical protein
MIDDIIIIDNCLDTTSLKVLQNYFVKEQNKLNWCYFEGIVKNENGITKNFTNPSLIDTKIGDGFVISIPDEYITIDKNILSIIYSIKSNVESILNKEFTYELRTKVNLNKPQIFSEQHIEKAVHIDRETPHTSYIFYINTNNGYTLLYDDDKNVIKKIDCIENRVLIFDGLIPHAGIPSTNDDKCVINCNILEKTNNSKLI